MSIKQTYNVVVLLAIILCGFANGQMCGKIKEVSGGENHSLALMEDGTLMGCGSNTDYVLGIGNNNSSFYTMQKVRGENGSGYLHNVATFDAGFYHSLAADTSGNAYAWGVNSSGNLGKGNTSAISYYPTKVKGVGGSNDLNHIIHVSAPQYGGHSLAVDSNGFAYGWGLNTSKQCGDNSSDTKKYYPVKVLKQAGVFLTDIRKVEAGTSHSLALDSSGYVWHWGTNNADTSGYASKVKKSSAFGGTELTNIVQIAACSHSVAVDSSGFVWWWTSSNSAAKVTGLSNIIAVSAGVNYNIALDQNKNVWQWNNGSAPARVTDGDMQTQSGNLENIIAIAAGYDPHMLAVDNEGYGWAWGTDNEDGRFGVGDALSHPEPTKILCPDESKRTYLTKIFTIEGIETECVSPFDGNLGNYLRFTISYANPVTNPSDPNYIGTIYDVNIIDILPDGLDFYSKTGGATYNSADHMVTLSLSSIAPGSSGTFDIVTKVNKKNLPLSNIHNTALLDADNYYAQSDVNVPVCDWSGGIIYVKKNATGLNNGTSWDDAYKELRDAVTSVQLYDGNAVAVWVAAGTYKPVVDTNVPSYQSKSFALLNNIALIGHFGGYEESPDDRVLSNPANETILDGKIGTTVSQAVYNIVKAVNVSNVLIDGFTIKGAFGNSSSSGIYLEDSDVSISIVNCRIEKNNSYGIYAKVYSYPDIHNCTFFSNTSAGLYNTGNCQPAVSYSVFDGNNVDSTYGLYMTSNCAATVSNSIFKNNKTSGIYGQSIGNLYAVDCNFISNYDGLYLSDITTSLTDCNIENSSHYGLSSTGSNIAIENTKVKNSTSYGLYFSNNSIVALTKTSLIKNLGGIFAYNSDFTLYHCLIHGNLDNGVYTSTGCNPTINNSIIRLSGGHGLEFIDNTTTTIKNTWINNNGTQRDSSNGGAGVYLENSTQTPLIRNVTIYKNWTYGVYAARYGADPNIRNCIIYSNGTSDSNDLVREAGGDPFTKVNYNYLQTTHSGIGNFVDNPLFTFSPDANDLHLSYNSPCIDKGDPCGIYANEKDIDDERRNNGRLDVGADENFWSRADYNLDGTVNFIDYAKLAVKWLKIDAQISLDGDTDVDLADLKLFCNDWLWVKHDGLGWLNDMQSMSLGYSMPQEDSITMMAQLDTESLKTADKKAANNSLLITDVKKSKALRPQRLAQKTDFFYSITKQSVEARKSAANPKPIDVNELAAWAQKMWNEDPELRATTTEKEWFVLIEEIKKSQ